MGNTNAVKSVKLYRVLYIHDLKTNLLSVFEITDQGFEVRFRKSDAIVEDRKDQVLLIADRVENVYFVRKDEEANRVDTDTFPKNDAEEWHCKMEHSNNRDLNYIFKNGVLHGINMNSTDNFHDCAVCISEKQVRAQFLILEENRFNDLLEIVHSDVCGLYRHSTHSRAKCYMTFIDDF